MNPIRRALSWLRSTGRSGRERGQTLVLFVIVSVVLVGAVAIVTDVSWLWVNQQRTQRAADAAALAGAIYLPGDPATAYNTARAEAAKNGYIHGSNGIVVTPVQDARNRRRLNVTISGPVGTYFARVFCYQGGPCLETVAVGATGRAEYVLPVPMGSPEAYYGIGTFQRGVAQPPTITTASGDTGWHVQKGTPSGAWTTPQNADDSDNDAFATSQTTNNSVQQWGTFGMIAATSPVQPSGTSIIPNPGTGQTLAINGLELRVRARFNTSSGSANGCELRAELSWNNGSSWTTPVAFTPALTDSEQTLTLGSATSTGAWGRSFTRAELGNLRVRLTWIRPSSCGSTKAAQVDTLNVRASYTTTTTTANPPILTTQTINAPSGTLLPSRGFWGAIITKGGQRGNGDQFSPANNGGTTANPDFDPEGHSYEVKIGGGNGRVDIYDAPFCETDDNTSPGAGGWLGAGDHWIGGAANPVTTVFNLYDTNGTALIHEDDTLVATSGNTFANQNGVDPTMAFGIGTARTGQPNCSGLAYHNDWYPLASGLSAGIYRLNVTTNSAGNLSTNAENGWSVWVNASGQAKIYGEGRMVAYSNLTAGRQTFYLSQIEAQHAGKTMQITLHDPGDVSGNAYLRILTPNGNAYNYATFSYSATNGRTGNNVNVIQTANSGGSLYDNQQITILIPLPITYGTTGLLPSGESEEGWWKIEYEVNGGNDTTTWQVAIRGNPVHLVP